jgi:hypothetical protein
MPTWGELIREINDAAADLAKLPLGTSPFDLVRRKYLVAAQAHTGRALIVYATKWTQPPEGPLATSPVQLMINDEDVQGFMEAVHGIGSDQLDLILHSPGGSPTAAEALVSYLRSKFAHIRVIVPHMAMSAATMIACAADEIVMGAHSFLGPIDPQMALNTALGLRMVPAQAIIEQFERATLECQDPAKVRAWLPMLSQYGPDLLITCKNATDLGQQLVSEWLAKYMFHGQQDAAARAEAIAAWLGTHGNFKTHGRTLSRDTLIARGVNVTPLENDQVAQDLFLSVFHMVTHTFNQTGAVKIIENHLGKAFIKTVQQVLVGQPQPALQQPLPAPKPPAQPALPALNRQQRRAVRHK